MSVIIRLLSKFDDTGLKKAKSGFGGLTKSLGALGIGLGLKQLTDGLVEAAKAASMDQKSTQLLNTQLSKNTNATAAQIANNDKFIQSLSNQVGVVDDELRPAQARLARATGSVSKSQELLKLSLNASVVSGKPLTKVSTDIARAFTGNTKALEKLFPQLKGSKDLFGDLAKITGDAAAEQATPFDKLNVAMDNLKEKLGVIILPIITDFIDQMMKPGGAIDQVGKFLDDVSNPKTEAGKTFTDIKDAVAETIGGVKDFFALFGNGDAMKGFANIATSLIKMLPALLVLKGIMMLASAGKAIQSLVTAMTMIQGKSLVPAPTSGIPPIAPIGNPSTLASNGLKALPFLKLLPLVGANSEISPLSDSVVQKLLNDPNFSESKKAELRKQYGITNNVTINVQGTDPKATVDALSRYLKQNGSLPFTGKAGR